MAKKVNPENTWGFWVFLGITNDLLFLRRDFHYSRFCFCTVRQPMHLACPRRMPCSCHATAPAAFLSSESSAQCHR